MARTPYRLIALDVDGTTVDTGRPPSPRVLRALAAAQERGLRVVLATGRAFASALHYASTLGVHGPLVCMQGAVVKEQNNGQHTLMVDCMPYEPLLDVIRFADERNLELSLYTENEAYVAHRRHDQHYYDLWFGLPTHEVTDLAATAAGLAARGEPAIKTLFIDEPENLDLLAADLNAHFAGRLDVVRSHPMFLELLKPGVSKGRALAFLAERYSVPQAETIAVGDSDNDISMLQWAGLGIAVANAAPGVQAAANWLAPSVSDDGVAVVIERYLLGEAA